MFYENELRFLCDILKKCRVQVSFAQPDDSIDKIIDDSFRMLFINIDGELPTLKDIFGDVQSNTLYKFANPLKLCYLFLLLPYTASDTIMVVGPYLPKPINNRQILEISENNNISPHKQKFLQQYYNNITVLDESDKVFNIIESFSERIWGGIGSYAIVDSEYSFTISPQILTKLNVDGGEDILYSMKFMEQRYAYENELMSAVSMGNDHKVANILSSFSKFAFDRRSSDLAKNNRYYFIVMNTLLRKAAEEGGVHPLYLDDISSKYASKIDLLNSSDNVQDLMSEMFKSYCRLVRKHSTKKYSSTVQKTIALIDYDLSANLSLSSLAKLQNISSGYLSTVFKKETGKTLTEYIIDKRIALALRLLSTTRLQVQTVALHCGIMDVQYFSKIFKKKVGKTPKEYRESMTVK